MTAKNTFENPDFSYPEDVMAAADSVLTSRQATDLDRVNAVTQYARAMTMRDADSLAVVLRRIDDVTAQLTAPDARALLLMYKASMLKAAYQFFSYKIVDNVLPLDSLPDNPALWSVQHFQHQIQSCVDQAIVELESVQCNPLKRYAAIVKWYPNNRTDDDSQLKYSPYLRDFIFYHAIQCVEGKREQYVAEMCRRAEVGSLEWVEWNSMRSDYDPLALYQLFPRGDVGAALLLDAAKRTSRQPDDEQQALQLIDLIDKQLTDSSASLDFANDLRNALIVLKRSTVTLESESSLFAVGSQIKLVLKSRFCSKVGIAVYDSTNSTQSIERRTPLFIKEVETPYSGISRLDTISFRLDTPGDYSLRLMADGKFHNSYLRDISVLPYVPVVIPSQKSLSIVLFDATTNLPAANVEVGFISARSKFNSLGCTNSDGILVVDSDKVNRSEGRKLATRDSRGTCAYDVYLNRSSYMERPATAGSIDVQFFTPRRIYHRGDTVQWSLVAYDRGQQSVVPNRTLDLQFVDANGEVFESQSVTTDQYGRAFGRVLLPEDRLAGTYHIRYTKTDSWYNSGLSLEVSDFKIPAFEIVDLDANLNEANTYVITGRCRTFSGAAVGFADMKVLEDGQSWYRRINKYEVLARTSAAEDGSFRFEIPADSLAEEGLVMLKVIANAPSNDAAEASLSIRTGRQAQINFNLRALEFNLDEPVNINGQVENPAHRAIEVDLNWRLLGNDSTQVASGSFTSNLQGSVALDLSAVPAGKYKLEIAPADSSMAEPISGEICLYSLRQNAVPVSAQYISPNKDLTADNGGRATIVVGVPVPRQAVLLAAADDSNGVFVAKMVHLQAGFNNIDVQLPSTANRAEFALTFVNGVKPYVLKYTVNRPDKAQFTIDIESWRDNAVAGSPCKWSINLRRADGAPVDAAMVASLYNRALDMLAGPRPGFLSPDHFAKRIILLESPNILHSYGLRMSLQAETPTLRWLISNDMSSLCYNYMMSLSRSYRNAPCRSVGMASTGMAMEACEAAPVCENEESVESSDDRQLSKADSTAEESQIVTTEYRQGDVLEALWLPDLTTNADGSVTIDFTLPNANGRWAFLLSAWTADLHTNGLSREITISKPLMVQPSLPRFLRHSDHATLCATVYNTSDQALDATAIIEVYNPENDSIIASSKQVFSIVANGSAIASVPVVMTTDLRSIGVRVKAASAHFSDGEVNLLPVLEATSTVVESNTFYLNAERPVFEIQLPDNLGENTTLQYCQNPIWEVVKTLPQLYCGEIRTATGAASALFGAAISQGIAAQHPEVLEGINLWMEKGGDALRSALYKNEELKLATLSQTPWMAAAASQTERMQRIALTLDSDNATAVYNNAIKRLAALQNPDGGFRWIECYDESSLWGTVTVLKYLGMANSCGLLPDDHNLNEVVDKAFSYLDRNTKDIEIDYALVYSLFPERKSSTLAGKQAIGDAVEYILAHRQDLTTASRAVAALVLEANGRHASAVELLRSLRQFQIKSPLAGISYPSVDNINSYAHILMAFAKIDPQPAELDAMRQWLVLRAQVTDDLGTWCPTYLIYAILGSGSEWTSLPDDASVITIDGQAITPDRFEQLTGNIVYRLPASASGSTLRIDRPADSSVSYGGVTTISTRPTADIQAHALPELSISKRILAQRNGQWAETTDLIAGEQVRVDLTVTSARDMEYVTIDDQRAANLQPLPSEQLARTVWASSTLFYRENNDDCTRLFVHFMPRGSYHFQYTMTVTTAGTFASGLATIQSQLAPAVTAHSAASTIIAK